MIADGIAGLFGLFLVTVGLGVISVWISIFTQINASRKDKS